MRSLLPRPGASDDAGCIDTHLRTLTLVSFLAWTGQRLGAFAMPFVVLEHTGERWATGLVAGCIGIAMVTSLWWGAPLRDRLRTPRSVVVLLLVQALGSVVLPLAVAAGVAGVGSLLVSGCVIGVGAALQTPAVKSVTMAWGVDGDSPDRALRSLAWQDFAQRLPMTFAPLLGAVMLGSSGSLSPLLLQAALLVVAAIATATVPAPPDAGMAGAQRSARARDVLAGRPVLTAALVLSAVAGLCWFPLPLGLALLGVELGRAGELAAAGLAGYGAVTVLSSVLAPRWAARLSPVPVILACWGVLGAATMALPALGAQVWAIALVAGVGGALVPFGNAALNALVSELPDDSARHTVFTMHLACYSGGTSIGLMLGGAIIAWTGAVAAIVAAGAVLVGAVAVAGVVLGVRGRMRGSRMRGGRLRGGSARRFKAPGA